MTSLPPVIGLMATKDRPKWAARAARYFQAQTYRGPKQLLVWDDGSDNIDLDSPQSIFMNDWIDPMLLDAPLSLPAKRNAMMSYFIENESTFVEHNDVIFFVWDDDDYHGPERIQRQVEKLIANPDADHCVLCPTFFYDEPSNIVKWFNHKPFDGSLAFRLSFWKDRHWNESIDPGSGSLMVGGRDVKKRAVIPGKMHYIVVQHAPYATDGRGGHRFPQQNIHGALFADADLSGDFVKKLLTM